MVEQKRVSFSKQASYRMVNSKFPPITLFDDVIDETDFETAYALQALTNPRHLDELGDLNLIPTNEIPFGITGVNYVTAPFTHVTPDGSRFSDGSFGILYLADTAETAIAETRYHQEKYFRNVEGLHYDTVDMRCLKVKFSAELIDAVSLDDIHTPDDYTASRVFGAKVKKAEEAGIQYRSVRNKGAFCWGLMSPVHVGSAVQTQHFEFVFDGKGISKVRELTMEC
ncbi:RES family NAD+ phosphorylase [Colwellia sp. UCD-KL20]|uniref:RES family NAD+ phosphorylase n=1 Tax=Colwellia sp. UCD-KL20 TaxID=1917165 RepID=UPI000970E57F|nr:RES family NAD+ phosphorylase [Colwellia sp. UCD-KL20]